MKWFELSINTTNEAVEPIANILHEAGASGVAIEDSTELNKEHDSMYGEIYDLNKADYPTDGVNVKAYINDSDEFNDIVATIKTNIEKLNDYGIDVGSVDLIVKEVKEEDWAHAWKKYYHPVKVSEKITIVPSWEEYEKSEDELIIELDPGMAFGTGTHPTTKMCIQALDKVVKNGDTVIDVGTGSGVLSIAAAKLGASKVIAVDLDEVAVSAAKENVNLNNVNNVVSVFKSDLLSFSTEEVDIVVANILADVVIKLTSDASKAVKRDGYFVSSGIINAKKAEVKRALEQVSFTVIDEINEDDWVALIAKKN